jgi:hypothetical protein
VTRLRLSLDKTIQFISGDDLMRGCVPIVWVSTMTRKQMDPVSVMYLGRISYYDVCTLVPVEGNMNTEQYISALDDNICSVIVRHFFK